MKRGTGLFSLRNNSNNMVASTLLSMNIDNIKQKKHKSFQVTWASSSPMIEKLADQIRPVRGVINIPSGVSTASFTIEILQDTIPEFTSWFTVNLIAVSSGASIQTAKSMVNVTTVQSDFPYGRVAFAVDSRYVFMPFFSFLKSKST